MSWNMTGAAVDYGRTHGLPAPRRHVLLLLANYADDAGNCFPKQDRLADESGLSVQTVRKCIREFEAAGILKTTSRNRSEGRGRISNLYTLDLPQPGRGRSVEQPAITHEQTVSGGSQDLPQPQRGRSGPTAPSDTTNRALVAVAFNEESQLEPQLNPPTPQGEDPVVEVFEFWRTRYSPSAKLDQKRKSRISARLKEGFTVVELCTAIDNARHDDWLSGRDRLSRGYLNKLHTILRDAEQVERLRDLVPPNAEAITDADSYDDALVVSR